MPSGQNNKHPPQLATSQVVRQLNEMTHTKHLAQSKCLINVNFIKLTYIFFRFMLHFKVPFIVLSIYLPKSLAHLIFITIP